MRILVLMGWLLLPVAALAYHYGPGQRQTKLDEAGALLAKANAALKAEDHAKAVEAFDEALSALPADRVAARQSARLERAKASMQIGKTPEAQEELRTLVDELSADAKADPKTLAGAREALANASYYVTWLMRVEGFTQDDWEPQVEMARQNYKLLAADASARGDGESAERHLRDLEAAVRLARLDVGDLNGAPLPKQCQNCCSCKSKCRGKKPGKKKPEDARGAGGPAEIPGGGH